MRAHCRLVTCSSREPPTAQSRPTSSTSRPSSTRKHWDAPDRDTWQKPKDVVKLSADRSRGMTVVDLGAGTGYFAPHLSARAGKDGKVLALDVEPQLVEHIEGAVRQEVESWPTARRASCRTTTRSSRPPSVDRVLTVDTWHHIRQARGSTRRKLAAALKPGGFVGRRSTTPSTAPKAAQGAPHGARSRSSRSSRPAASTAENRRREAAAQVRGLGRAPPPSALHRADVRPRTMRRWKPRTSTAMGAVATMVAAEDLTPGIWYWPREEGDGDRDGAAVGLDGEGERRRGARSRRR
jgi:SAM-dependent methyltransferase